MRVAGDQQGPGCTKFEQQNFLCSALSLPTDLNMPPPLHGKLLVLAFERVQGDGRQSSFLLCRSAACTWHVPLEEKISIC